MVIESLCMCLCMRPRPDSNPLWGRVWHRGLHGLRWRQRPWINHTCTTQLTGYELWSFYIFFFVDFFCWSDELWREIFRFSDQILRCNLFEKCSVGVLLHIRKGSRDVKRFLIGGKWSPRDGEHAWWVRNLFTALGNLLNCGLPSCNLFM